MDLILQDYALFFTSASLMSFETKHVSVLYFKYKDWVKIENLIVEDNIMRKVQFLLDKESF